MSSPTEIQRLTPEEILEKRRSTLISRTRAVRLQLASLSFLDKSYDTCRQSLRQWRIQMLDQVSKAHETSVAQLNDAYEQINRFCSIIVTLLNEKKSDDQHEQSTSTLSPSPTTSIPLKQLEATLNSLLNAEFTFDFDRAKQIEGKLELLKLSQPQGQYRLFNKLNTKCRLLVPRDRHISAVFFYDNLITRIDCQTPECILICPFYLLADLLSNDEEVRILVDQIYLPFIGTQAQRMRLDYNLLLLQPAQECCPKSSERIIRIICKDLVKMLSCLEEIYTICSQQATPMTYNPYSPVNYNRSKTHLYGGYSDISSQSLSTPNKNISRANSSLSETLNTTFLTPNTSVSSSSSSLFSSPSTSSQQHFDRLLMPISIHQTLSIMDAQAGALLGPKGERIQQLQRDTGAIVNISDSNDDNGDRRKRIVNIYGNEKQVSNALEVIKKLLAIYHQDDTCDGSLTRDAEKIRRP